MASSDGMANSASTSNRPSWTSVTRPPTQRKRSERACVVSAVVIARHARSVGIALELFTCASDGLDMETSDRSGSLAVA